MAPLQTMISVQHVNDNTSCRFILRPNQSLSWRGNQFFLFVLAMVCLGVAIPLALMGFWVILPFAGLELAAVACGLYIAARRGQRQEVIDINGDTIQIESGYQQPEKRWVLTRIWARVILERCTKQWYPSRLLIRSRGHTVEVGSFLNEDERQRLASELSRSL